jgi:hypothetical protein
MDAFEKAGRKHFADLDEAGVIIPKSYRETLMETLVIDMRAAGHTARRDASLSPMRTIAEIKDDLAWYQAELQAAEAAARKLEQADA